MESVLVDNEQVRALTISRLLRVDDVSSHFIGSLFSSPAKVESFRHVDVVHGAVEGAGVEDLALDQGGALKAWVGNNIWGIVVRKVTEISIALAWSHWRVGEGGLGGGEGGGGDPHGGRAESGEANCV